jgi:CRP-like cAMP-binding protein
LNSPAEQQYKNQILRSLPKTDLNRLARHLSPVTLKQGQSLSNDTRYGYFLEQGIASVVVILENGDTVEVGVVGIDGVVGLPILLGTPQPPGRTFIQIAGSGFQIKAQVLKEEFDRPGELRSLIHKYLQAFFVQSAQTAACNRLHGIEERLARWLSSCSDRVEGNELRLTHGFLSQMLGAPRTTVTAAAGLLQRAGMIGYSRGRVTILDRAELEKTACECYRVVRDEFKRLKLL